jgi:hypothetical protein
MNERIVSIDITHLVRAALGHPDHHGIHDTPATHLHDEITDGCRESGFQSAIRDSGSHPDR